VDADYSDHSHVWNIAMVVSSQDEQACWLLMVVINNFGAVVDGNCKKLDSCSACQLAIYDSQGM